MNETTAAPLRMRFGAVILAAGASARMGRPKQALTVGGRPMVVRAAEAALEAGAWPVVVVVGAHAAEVTALLARLPVLAVDNPVWTEGMASSVRAGVDTLERFSRALEAALVAVCDQPAFGAEAIGRLIEARARSGRSIAAARYRARLGVPALFGRGEFAALRTLTGEAGARELLNGRPERVAAVEMPELEADLDRPEDYAKIVH
jgi:molybdenum cofactor cytidylyltransferase